jgi:hypothetical protein
MSAANVGRSLSRLARQTTLPAIQSHALRGVHLSAANIPLAKYGGRHTVTMMPGDGIGPEMMDYLKEVFKVAGAPVDFETVLLDPTTDNYDDLYNAIQSVKRNGCGIKESDVNVHENQCVFETLFKIWNRILLKTRSCSRSATLISKK